MECASLWGYYVHDLNPFLIQWSETWGIRYYGLAYLVSFMTFYFGMRWFARRGWSELPADRVGDLLTWTVVGTLIGGRLGYCLLYDWYATWRDPISVVAFWRGGISGMASHGGFAGVVLAVFLFARKEGLRLWPLFDNVTMWVPPGFFFGRVANFINGELWGRVSDVPWAVIFPDAPGAGIPRHPSQLYQAFGEGLVLFALLWWLRLRHPATGVLSGVFLASYGVARVIGECFRQPDAHIGYYWSVITQGQILSVVLIVAGMVIAWLGHRGSLSERGGKSRS